MKKIRTMIENDETIYTTSVILLNLLSIPTFLSTFFITAPYGRHSSPGWGPTIPSWVSWAAMESPSIFLTLFIYSFGRSAAAPDSLALLSLFIIHYLQRTLIYPLRIRTTKTTQFPVLLTLVAFSFNVLNSYAQARTISHYGEHGVSQLSRPGFWVGGVVFMVGMGVNVRCDGVLVGLKKGGRGYGIPRGGVFEWVSCGNYFGEILEWLGWAIMTWSWAGLGFFVYTLSNLVPRALAHHMWYLDKFGEDYPRHRKAVVPFLY